MQLGLLWGPSLERIGIQQTTDEVGKGKSVVHFYALLVHMFRGIKAPLASVDLALLHVLPRHRIASDDLRQRCGLKILFARLLFRTMLPRVLLH